MPDLWRSNAAVVVCLADAETLDLLDVVGVLVCRVALDETLLVAPKAVGRRIEHDAIAQIGPGGLVIDQSSGWCCWTIVGVPPDEALSRLSAVPPAKEVPAFRQGAFAGVQAKILMRERRLDVFVASTVYHHVAKRILAGCSDLDLREAPPREFELPEASIAGGRTKQ